MKLILSRSFCLFQFNTRWRWWGACVMLTSTIFTSAGISLHFTALLSAERCWTLSLVTSMPSKSLWCLYMVSGFNLSLFFHRRWKQQKGLVGCDCRFQSVDFFFTASHADVTAVWAYRSFHFLRFIFVLMCFLGYCRIQMGLDHVFKRVSWICHWSMGQCFHSCWHFSTYDKCPHSKDR